MSNFNVTHNIDFGIKLQVQQEHLARNAKEVDKLTSYLPFYDELNGGSKDDQKQYI